MYAVILTVII